ncbi:MAG: hypothetical protein IJN70_07515 [Clostridia bacterium]|nr:hypothetical protein [Clostridia bacterium]
MKKIKSKKSILVAIVLIVVGVIFFMTYDFSPKKAEFSDLLNVLDSIRSFYDTYGDDPDYKEDAIEKDFDKINKAIDKIYLDYSRVEKEQFDKRFTVTEADVANYISNYGEEGFYSLIKDLERWLMRKMSNLSMHSAAAETCDECWCGALEQMIRVWQELHNDICYLEQLNENSPGYYFNNPSAYPPRDYTEDVDGLFYQADGTGAHTQTAKDYYITEYKGDFAVLTANRNKYNAGRYEWEDGVFYDETPSWSTYSYQHLYYVGEKVCSIETNDKNCRFFETSDYVFVMIDRETDVAAFSDSHYYTYLDIIEK